MHKNGPHVLAAPDACAQGQTAGIGGWWMLPSDGICPAFIFWFSKAAELPDWFVQVHGRSDLQKYICALEALAQLVLSKLLLADSQVCPTSSCVGHVGSQQAFVHAADVLQAMATLCMQRQAVLQVSHVAGQRNAWAEGGQEADRQNFGRPWTLAEA